ncbi:hypothetical protein [Streptomyces sp. 8N616]|uniref:hypothetical protein n=1 Tax=Streptomyces sp. 8N616 TaxID=3457414 RepID=UPI003FD29109
MKLSSWLVDEIWHDERRGEPIRAELLGHMRVERIEPPTSHQVTTLIRSARSEADRTAHRSANLLEAGGVRLGVGSGRVGEDQGVQPPRTPALR